MSYPNDTNVVFQYLVLILLKIAPFESSIEKEKYFHYHYENMSVQYAAISKSDKNDSFQMKNCDSFLHFTQNINCWYTLEPPQ